MTALYGVSHIPKHLSKLRKQGIKVDTTTAACNKRRLRDADKAKPVPPMGIKTIIEKQTLAYIDEIERRGGEVWVGKERLRPIDRSGGLVLLAAQGWREYSRSFGNRFAGIAYLCGHDDAGRWAVRVPSTVATVAEAIRWVTPHEVRNAQARGKRVHRQGDMYAIEARLDDLRELRDTRHVWNAETRTLEHPEHAPLTIDHPVRFVQQRVLAMGRVNRRAGGD